MTLLPRELSRTKEIHKPGCEEIELNIRRCEDRGDGTRVLYRKTLTLALIQSRQRSHDMLSHLPFLQSNLLRTLQSLNC